MGSVTSCLFSSDPDPALQTARCAVLLDVARGFVDKHCTVEAGAFTPGNACATAFMIYYRQNATAEQAAVMGDSRVLDMDAAYQVCAAATELGVKHAVYPIVNRRYTLRMVVGLRVDTVP